MELQQMEKRVARRVGRENTMPRIMEMMKLLRHIPGTEAQVRMRTIWEMMRRALLKFKLKLLNWLSQRQRREKMSGEWIPPLRPFKLGKKLLKTLWAKFLSHPLGLETKTMMKKIRSAVVEIVLTINLGLGFKTKLRNLAKFLVMLKSTRRP